VSATPSALVVGDDLDMTALEQQQRQREPLRKDSVLTQKMKDWEGEKAKRQEKKHRKHGDRKHAGPHGHAANGSAAHDGIASARPASGLPHDDEVPTGLLSPSGAFSHSPNHATSPTASPGPMPSPSQLTSHWEVRIIGAGIRFDPKPFVMYQLLVKNGPTLKWTIVKRYSGFEELHQRLKKAIPSFDAQLPKKHFFNNLDQQFIQNRKQELQTYLGQLLWNRTVQESVELQQFLLPSPDDAKWAQQTPGGTQSGTSTPSSSQSSTFSFFRKDKDKEKEKDGKEKEPNTGAAAVATATAPQHIHHHHSQSTHAAAPALARSSTFAVRGSHAPLQQHTLPTSSGISALHQASVDDSEVFARSNKTHDGASSLGYTTTAHLESPTRARHTLPQQPPPAAGAAAGADPSWVGGPLATASPPVSPPPPSRSSAAATVAIRTYSADDLAARPHRAGVPTSVGAVPSFPIVAPGSVMSGGLLPASVWEDKSLTDPLYLLVEEIFNLNGRGWMRRQATWVGKQLVKMFMDDVVKDKLNKQVGDLLNEQSLTAQIDWLTDLIWPDGKLFESRAAITDEEREEVKEEALRLLLASIPTGLRTMLGKEHCVAAVKKSNRHITTNSRRSRVHAKMGVDESSCGLGISLCACVDCSAVLECCRCFEFLQMSPLLEHFVRRQGTDCARPLARSSQRSLLTICSAVSCPCPLLSLYTGLLRARQPRPRAVPRSDACARQMSAMIIVGSRFSLRAFLSFSLPILPLSSTFTHAAAGRRCVP